MGGSTGPQKAVVWVFMAGLTAFLLTGCATAPSRLSSAGYPAQTAVAHAAEGYEFVSPPPDYILQPGDQFAVKFHYHSAYDQELTVRPDGKVVLPGLGVLPAAGRKPEELAQVIAKGYSDILRDPEVDIQVKRFSGQRIYVGGEVFKPGFVDLSAGLTTLQAVVQAGGFRDTAKLSNIVIVRGASRPEGATAEGDVKKPEGILVNLQDVLEGKDLSKDVVLQPYDIVYVPKTAIAKANQFVEEYLVRMLPIRPGVGIGF
jgi:protein involved in polysaccharide export with SLBB domain